jgi:hypothetical protein
VKDALQGRHDDCNPNALRLVQGFFHHVKEHADVNGDDELMETTQDALDELTDYLDDGGAPAAPRR